MDKNSLSLAKLWSLLRDQEKQLGLDNLSLTERDIFLCILFLQEKNKLVSLENITKSCKHQRATLFRCLNNLKGYRPHAPTPLQFSGWRPKKLSLRKA